MHARGKGGLMGQWLRSGKLGLSYEESKAYFKACGRLWADTQEGNLVLTVFDGTVVEDYTVFKDEEG